MTKQTAANCVTLAYVKRTMNAKIYKKFAALINDGAVAAAREFYGSFFKAEYRNRAIALAFNN